LEGSGRGLGEIFSCHLLGIFEEDHENLRIGVLGEIGTENLPDSSLQRYRYGNLFGNFLNPFSF
jgi:hypothetical protein